MSAGDDQLQETWSRLMGLFLSRRNVLFEAMADLQLTPPHGHALVTLLHGGPTRMRDMAQSMACDASYITAVADRLEELGLAERRLAADDRRARELALTPRGEEVARGLDAVFAHPPASMRALPKADREALARIARKLADAPAADGGAPPLKVR